MAVIFVHWVGTLKGDVDTPLHDDVKEIDQWFPAAKPDGATLIATDEIAEEVEVFHGAYKGSFKIGPFHATLGVNVKFKGKIEYWKAPAA